MSTAAGDRTAPAAEVAPPAIPTWGLGKRLGFRFLFSYILLYAFPFPLGLLPGTGRTHELYGALLDPLVLWAGANVLGIDAPIATAGNGSGDRTYDYVLVFCQLVLAVAAAATWSLIDRRARRHDRLLAWLRLFVRVYLGTWMLSYGFAKIFQVQFQPPGPGQLIKTYGESSPMNLLWTLMGFSRPYAMFGGFMEAIPGLLLFFRRTAVAGALVLVGVLGNVVLLNFCFDVPVKLYSAHLWLMSLFLAAPGLSRVAAALILERSVAPAPSMPLLTSRRARIAGIALYAAGSATLAYQVIVPSLRFHLDVTSLPRETAAVRDLFDVDRMSVNGNDVPHGAPQRWTRVWIRPFGIRLYRQDGKTDFYLTAGPIEGPGPLELRLPTDDQAVVRARLDLRRDNAGYALTGSFDGAPIAVHLTRKPTGDSILMSRGFHWINEAPFNR